MSRLLLLLPLAVLLGCARPRPSEPDTAPTATPDLDFPVGAFALNDQTGKTVNEKDLLGKVWIASFVFTRCTGPCPAVTATVARLQKELPNDPASLMFVTFTVDPQRDRVKELAAYAAPFRADPKRWLFLTGDEETIHELVQKRFLLAVSRRTGPAVKEGEEFDHSTRLALVDRKGTVRATYDGVVNEEFPDGKEQFEEGLAKLKEKVAELLAEK